MSPTKPDHLAVFRSSHASVRRKYYAVDQGVGELPHVCHDHPVTGERRITESLESRELAYIVLHGSARKTLAPKARERLTLRARAVELCGIEHTVRTAGGWITTTIVFADGKFESAEAEYFREQAPNQHSEQTVVS